MVTTTFLSTSTSNGKELSASTKKVDEWKGKQDLYMLPIRDSLQIKRHRLKGSRLTSD